MGGLATGALAQRHVEDRGEQVARRGAARGPEEADQIEHALGRACDRPGERQEDVDRFLLVEGGRAQRERGLLLHSDAAHARECVVTGRRR